MSKLLIDVIGFVAQILFSSRLIVQWLTSEKHKKVVTPVLFWMLSLIASLLLFIYGYLRNDFAIMLGQSLTYYIYIRNLQIQGQWQKSPKVLQLFLFLFPVIVVIFGYNNGRYDLLSLFDNKDIPTWLLTLGIIAQLTFTLRFVYQWITSERNKNSQLPIGFWRMSVVGAVLILSYAIIREDPVLFIGHCAGLVIYIRNIFIWKKQHYEVS